MQRTCAAGPEETESLHESIGTLRADKDFRKRIQLVLVPLHLSAAALAIDNLSKPTLKGPRRPRLIVGWSIVCIAALVAMGATVLSWKFLIAIMLVNFLVVARMGVHQAELSRSMQAMVRMLRVADRLSRNYKGQPVSQLADLVSAVDARRKAARAFRLFGVADRLPLGSGAWLNFLFLGQWLTYLYTVNRVSAVRQQLRDVYELLGYLDATIALASFLERVETWCRADIGPQRVIEIEGGRHPLLDRRVPNSLMLGERSALVTGSNMAGKKTFVKMVAIDAILGQMLGVCLAERAMVPPSPVMVCIRSQESVQSGKSQYFAEVEAIPSFLRPGAHSPLVVVDEPFSGTNTSERIAAAKSVLGALSEHSLVLATTHDVELQELLR